MSSSKTAFVFCFCLFQSKVCTVFRVGRTLVIPNKHQMREDRLVYPKDCQSLVSIKLLLLLQERVVQAKAQLLVCCCIYIFIIDCCNLCDLSCVCFSHASSYFTFQFSHYFYKYGLEARGSDIKYESGTQQLTSNICTITLVSCSEPCSWSSCE